MVAGLLLAAALVAGGVLLVPRLPGRSTTATTGASAATAAVAGQAVLLRLVERERAPVVVVVAPESKRSAVLGLPGDTLLQGDKGFDQLDDLLASQGIAGTAAPIDAVVGLRPGAVAAVSWADLRSALVAAGVTTTYADSLAAGGAAMGDQAAQAVAALAATLDTEKGKAALAALALSGDAPALRTALGKLSSGVKVVAGLPGREVEGTGFTYYEPDTSAVKTLLGGEQPASVVSVEVENGSGVVGVAERAVVAIRPLGFTMLPVKNADDFPDVQITQVLAGPASLGEADRVRAAIGAGKVIRQDTLPPGRLVVIVGSDLTVAVINAAAATSTTTATGAAGSVRPTSGGGATATTAATGAGATTAGTN